MDSMNLIEERFLAKGATSIIYVCTLDGKEVVAKKAKNPQWSRLDKEYSILRSLDGGLTPEVYGFIKEPDRIILVEEFIRGRHPDYRDADFTLQLAPQLAAFHKKWTNAKIEGVPEYTIDKFLRDHIDTVFGRFSPVFPERIKLSIESIIRRVKREIEENPGLFKDAPLTLVHTDLIPWNTFLEETGKARVIDWENARMDCAEWDVASFLRGFGADEKIRKLFFENYNYAISPGRLKLCEALHYLQAAVWWTDTNSGFEATDEIVSKVDADIDGAERFLA